jgi:hypothetical protein
MGIARFQIAGLVMLAAAVGGCSPRNFPGPGERLVIAHGDVEDRGSLRVPPGHMPNVGQCRVWFPGRPPGHQPKAGNCAGIQRSAPAGSWILYRPTSDKKVVHARVIDSKRPGVVVSVRIYDVDRGTYLRDEKPR